MKERKKKLLQVIATLIVVIKDVASILTAIKILFNL